VVQGTDQRKRGGEDTWYDTQGTVTPIELSTAICLVSSVAMKCQCHPPQGKESSNKDHLPLCDLRALKSACTGIRLDEMCKVWVVGLGRHHKAPTEQWGEQKHV